MTMCANNCCQWHDSAKILTPQKKCVKNDQWGRLLKNFNTHRRNAVTMECVLTMLKGCVVMAEREFMIMRTH